MRLTVFASCYGAQYAAFLPEWESCMSGMEVETVVVGDRHAANAWGGTGRFVLAPEHGSPYNQGAAHNHAALESQTEWIMHVGVDDLVAPDLVEQLRPHTEQADVIAVDVQRTRDGKPDTVRENRPTRELILQRTMGRQPLDACAAFRRACWERTGYRLDLPGGVDVALWIDMAHQGARFAYTAQVGVIYRLRPDSLWHQRSGSNIRQVRHALNKLREPTLATR